MQVAAFFDSPHFLDQLFQKLEKIIIFAILPKGCFWDVMVVVAQLVRAPDCGSGGRRFEPGLPPEGEVLQF
jgi:hypothetical protein